MPTAALDLRYFGFSQQWDCRLKPSSCNTSDLHKIYVDLVFLIIAVKCVNLQIARSQLKVSRIIIFSACMCPEFSGDNWYVCLS
jgi:hypothetical protein